MNSKIQNINNEEVTKMLIPNQKIKIKVNKVNKEWYEQKGYINIHKGEIIFINAEDLTPGSHVKVLVKCDYCGKITSVIWKDYVVRSNNKNACKNCRLKKSKRKHIKRKAKFIIFKSDVFL